MVTRNDSLWKTLDWVTIFIYLLLIVGGWFSVCGASYDYGERDFLDFSTRAGKQFVWIICSFGLGFVLLMLDDSLYDMFSYLIYIGLMLLLIVTIFIAPDTKGSRSWIILGPVSLQPAEFAKVATSLALARLFASYNFTLNSGALNYVKACAIILVPFVLIILQKETGSALVFLSLFFVLYREGMSGMVLLGALVSVIIFVVTVKFTETGPLGLPTGEFIVYLLIMTVMSGMLWINCRRHNLARNITLGFIAVVAGAMLLSEFTGTDLPGQWIFIGAIGAACVYCLFELMHDYTHKLMVTIGTAAAALAFMFSVSVVFNHVLEPHQQMRIKVALGIEEDLRGVGYNVNQSKIAIGSGGLAGKGFTARHTDQAEVCAGTTHRLYLLHHRRRGGLHRISRRARSISCTYTARHIYRRAPAYSLRTCLRLLCGLLFHLSFLYQHRHGHRPVSCNRNTAPFLQLWRLFALGIYNTAVHSATY